MINLSGSKQRGFINNNTKFASYKVKRNVNLIKRSLISFKAIKPEDTSVEHPLVIVTDLWEPHISVWLEQQKTWSGH